MAKNALGKGLGALLGENPAAQEEVAVSTGATSGLHSTTLKKTKLPAAIEMKEDGSITGGAIGTWKIEEGTSYITLKINNTYYHGVMVEQTLEPTDTKAPAFTAIAATTGTTVWGYQTEASGAG